MKKLDFMMTQLYDAPSRKIGEIFVVICSVDLDRFCARKWKSERVIVFKSIILQCKKDVNNYSQI